MHGSIAFVGVQRSFEFAKAGGKAFVEFTLEFFLKTNKTNIRLITRFLKFYIFNKTWIRNYIKSSKVPKAFYDFQSVIFETLP